MKKIIVFLATVIVATLSAQPTPKEALQRAIGTNVVTGSNAGSPFQLQNLAALKAIVVSTVTTGQTTTLLGYTLAGDGGGGRFLYDSSSVAAPNDTTVVQPTTGAGRWLRVAWDATSVPPTGANPTALIGLTAVNGVAPTFLRSDAAPALDVGISPTWTGIHTFTPAARSSGVAAYMTVTMPADTGLTASTESIGVNYAGATRTWAAGTLALQREHVFAAPTFNFASASALTVAVNVDFARPIAGPNTTLGIAYAIRADGILVDGKTAGNSARFHMNAGNSLTKNITFQTDSLARWHIGSASDAESTGNLGSTFTIARYTDLGAYIQDVMSINRADGGTTWFEHNNTFRYNSIGITSTTSAEITNDTSATVSLNQWSPALHFKGDGWKTTGATRVGSHWKVELKPTTGTTEPNNRLVFSADTSDTPTYVDKVVFDKVLGVSLTNALAVGGATISTSTALIAPAATTSVSSLRLLPSAGVSPSSPVNGDVWISSQILKVRLNGTTIDFQQSTSPTTNIGYANISASGYFVAQSSTGIVAGGGTIMLQLGTSTNFGLYCGSGAPTVSAPKGSLYLRTDGTTINDRIYVNTSGSTTWTYLTTGI